MLLLKYLAKLIKALASEDNPGQIAGGFILGMIIGLTPVTSPHNLLILFLILILRVNTGMAILSFLIFSGIAYLADPLFHNLGIFLLEHRSLQEMWTTLYNNEWVAATRFYNTVILGSLISSLLLCIPMYPMAKRGVIWYRENIHEKVMRSKWVKALKGTKLYTAYQTVNRLRG